MIRLWLALLGLSAATASLPAPAHAQGRSCRQVLASDFRRIIDTRGQEIVYFRDPVRFLCTGDVRLESDSAVVNRGLSTVELIGAVVYRDSTRELRSDWANYLGRLDQLLARGSTVVRDLVDGAVVRGDQLNYLRQTDDRPLATMIVTGDRPTATLPPRDDTAAAATEVRADRLELEGEEIFRALGDVELERGDIDGRGQTALFDQRAERMTLTGSAFVRTTAYRLDGDSIDALLDGDDLREVRSEGSARVTSDELAVRAQRVRIGFARGEVERLEAWNADPDAPRVRADAPDFRLRADSIDALADSVGMRELRAVGRAYGERDIPLDSLARPPALPGALARDWIQGDTILAFFDRAPATPDTAAVAAGADGLDLAQPADGLDLADAADGFGPVEEADRAEADTARVVLERIVVVGGAGPALSLYRMASDEVGGRPAINFMRASRIVLFMEQGEVGRVEAEGPIDGLYLDPTGEEAGGTEARPGAVGVEGAGP